MKIIIDARESGTSTGRYVDKLVEYLHKLDPRQDITVLVKSPRVDFMKTIAPNFEVVESNFKEFTFAEQIGLLKQINNLKPDLVHFTMTQQPVMYRNKSVTTIHDLTTIRFTNPAKNWLVFKFKQQIYKSVIKRVVKKSANIITPSEFVKNDVAQFTGIDPGKISVIYEAADKILDSPESIPKLTGKKFIMYVGRPTPHKNLERLVGAFSKLRDTNSDLFLVLIGKNDANYKRIKKLVSKLGLEQSVIFTGFVNEGQLRWLFEHTNAYVFPSLSEGFGLPGLEAMAHGAPVVSSNATCLPEIYGDGAIYFDPMDMDDMTAKINTVLKDVNLTEQLREVGFKQAKLYSWQATAKQTLALYEEILKGG